MTESRKGHVGWSPDFKAATPSTGIAEVGAGTVIAALRAERDQLRARVRELEADVAELIEALEPLRATAARLRAWTEARRGG